MNKLEQIDKTVTEIKSMLEKLINEKNYSSSIDRRLSMTEVAEVVGSFFGVSLKMMRSDSREGHIMRARHMARYIMIIDFYYTSEQVAQFIKCHRTTSYNTIHRTENWIEVDAKYRKLYKFVMEEIAKKSKKII